MSKTVPIANEKNVESDKDKVYGGLPDRSARKISTTRGSILKKSLSIFNKVLDKQKLKSPSISTLVDKPWYIIDHESISKSLFDYWMALMLTESNIISLYWLAFGEPVGRSLVYDTIMQIFFLIDFVLCFITSFSGHKHIKVVSQRQIAIRYITKWMALDLLALIPFRVFNLPSLEFFLRLSRIGKFNRIFLILKTLEVLIAEIALIFYHSKHIVNIVTNSLVNLAKVLLVMCFIIYFIACCFLRFTRYEDYNFENAYFEGHTHAHILLWTSYFIATTIISVGYGDFLPQNSSEQIAVVFIILIGAIYYAVLAGGFNSVIATIISLQPNNDNLNDLNAWLSKTEKRYKQLPHECREEIINHYNYYWSKDLLHNIAKEYWTASNYTELLADHDPYFKELTCELKNEILKSLFMRVFLRFKDFFGDTQMKYELCYHFQPRFYSPSQTILDEGEKVFELILIMKGKILAEISRSNISVNIIQNILGAYEILSGKACVFTYKTAHESLFPTEVLVIPKRPLLMIIQNGFPDEGPRMRILCERQHAELVKKLMKEKEGKDGKELNTGDQSGNRLLNDQIDSRRRRGKLLETQNVFSQAMYRSNEVNMENLSINCRNIEKKIKKLKGVLDKTPIPGKSNSNLPQIFPPLNKSSVPHK